MLIKREIYCFIKNFFLVDLYFTERERECVQAGEGQRERGDRGSKVGSVLMTESPMQGSNPRTNHDIMT